LFPLSYQRLENLFFFWFMAAICRLDYNGVPEVVKNTSFWCFFTQARKWSMLFRFSGAFLAVQHYKCAF